MATVKKGNVPPTHPTVWVGLALAVIGLLIAIYAYTGARVYDISFAFVAIAGGVLALAGIMTAAWGRSIMAARATRSRRALISQDAMSIARPADEPAGSEAIPTVAAPSSKKGFSFSMPKRKEKKEEPNEKAAGNVFAFKRRAAGPAPAPTPAPAAAEPEPLVTLVEPAAKPIRAKLKCPQCAEQFPVEGVRPFEVKCPSCGFTSTF